jgi:hypothetical protein
MGEGEKGGGKEQSDAVPHREKKVWRKDVRRTSNYCSKPDL